MSLKKETSDDFNTSQYRFLDEINPDNIRIVVTRSGVGRFVTYGRIEMALQPGIVFCDAQGNAYDEPLQSELQSTFKPFNDQITLGVGHKDAYGFCTFVMTSTRNGKNRLLALTATTPSYEIHYDKNEDVTQLKFDDRIHPSVPSGDVKTTTLEGAKLKNVFVYITRPDIEFSREGQSFLTPIWDNLLTLMTLTMSTHFILIKLGPGLKILQVPEDTWNNDEDITKLEKFIKSLNGQYAYGIFPSAPKDQGETKLEIITGGTGGQMAYTELMDMQLTPIAGHIVMPKNILTGIIAGETMASGVIRNLIFGSLQDIQVESRPVYDQVIKWLQDKKEKTKFNLPDGSTYKFKLQKEVNELDAVMVLQTRWAIVAQIMQLGQTTRMTQNGQGDTMQETTGGIELKKAMAFAGLEDESR